MRNLWHDSVIPKSQKDLVNKIIDHSRWHIEVDEQSNAGMNKKDDIISFNVLNFEKSNIPTVFHNQY